MQKTNRINLFTDEQRKQDHVYRITHEIDDMANSKPEMQAAYWRALWAYRKVIGGTDEENAESKRILELLLNGRPLHAIDIANERDWEVIRRSPQSTYIVKQCKSYPSLTYTINKLKEFFDIDNRIRIWDTDYAEGFDMLFPKKSKTFPFMLNVAHEKFPITFPYTPPLTPYRIMYSDFISKNGYRYVRIPYAITPEGDKVDVFRYFKIYGIYTDDDWEEISLQEFCKISDADFAERTKEKSDEDDKA